MNKRGFAISIILYSLVFLLITILFMILGILKTRYNVSSDIRESVIDEINSSDYAARVFKRNLMDKKTNMPVWIDTMNTPDIGDNVIYVAPINDKIGNQLCGTSVNCSGLVDSNYVWYSGKLWRIVAVYPDETMKLVTEDVITNIYWGESAEYNNSYMYQWLNEDFLDTLYNSNEIIENAIWNYTADNGNVSIRPESLSNQKTLRAKVGLLNAYEVYSTRYTADSPSDFYIHSYNQTQYNNTNNVLLKTYLYQGNTGGMWWLLNQDKSSKVRVIDGIGYLQSSYLPNEESFGIRPSIVLKRDVIFKGKGTKSEPYIISKDKEKPVYNSTLLNTRSSGEYVSFDNLTYRIVEVNNGNAYLIVNSLIEHDTMVGLASSNYWGKSTNDEYNYNCTGAPYYYSYPNCEYSDHYFNDTWYNNISTTYRNMIVDGSFYQGAYALEGATGPKSYKSTICAGNYNNVTVKNCTKYSTTNGEKFVGKVGLPRIGQMFSSSVISSDGMGVGIIPSTYLYSDGYGNPLYPGETMAYRPVIALSSSVKITGGNGTVDSPFRISL